MIKNKILKINIIIINILISISGVLLILAYFDLIRDEMFTLNFAKIASYILIYQSIFYIIKTFSFKLKVSIGMFWIYTIYVLVIIYNFYAIYAGVPIDITANIYALMPLYGAFYYNVESYLYKKYQKLT